MTKHYRQIDLNGMPPVAPASQPAPHLGWVELSSLVIDDRYQRPLLPGNWTAIRRIAREFSWARFSPIIVSPIEGGRYAIVDGQHRAHAAALCGFESVPAMIALIAPEEQAQAFIEINTRQIKVHRLTVYRAALAACEPWALASRDAVEAAGCELMTSARSTKDKKPGQVFATGLIRSLVEKGHDKAVRQGLRALMEFGPDKAALFSDMMLTPWLWAVAGTTTDLRTLVATLRATSPWIVLDVAATIAKQDGKPFATCRREAFMAAIRATQRGAK